MTPNDTPFTQAEQDAALYLLQGIHVDYEAIVTSLEAAVAKTLDSFKVLSQRLRDENEKLREALAPKEPIKEGIPLYGEDMLD